jgi:hypothetical protein
MQPNGSVCAAEVIKQGRAFELAVGQRFCGGYVRRILAAACCQFASYDEGPEGL